MNYLFDTNIVSEVRKGGDCNPHVAAWYDSIDEESIYLSVLVLGEIHKGIDRARSTNPTRAGALEKWLSALSRSFADRILPIDLAIADEWGRMSARRPVSTVVGGDGKGKSDDACNAKRRRCCRSRGQGF